jgi:hypothetical protein
MRRQADEIAADPALRCYGVALALLHVLAAYLRSRRTSDHALRSVIELTDFCARSPRYRPFGHNEWIQAAE